MNKPMPKPLVLLYSALAALLLGVAATMPPIIAQQPDPKPAPLTSAQRGERVFADNCSRCHRPPMTIPPQATGTVIMHMRVRARLSQQQQQDLLRYLAP